MKGQLRFSKPDNTLRRGDFKRIKEMVKRYTNKIPWHQTLHK